MRGWWRDDDERVSIFRCLERGFVGSVLDTKRILTSQEYLLKPRAQHCLLIVRLLSLGLTGLLRLLAKPLVQLQHVRGGDDLPSRLLHKVHCTRGPTRSRHDKAAPTRTLQLARTVVDSTTVGVAECGVVDGALSKLDRLLLSQVVPPAAAPPGTHTSAWVGGAMRHYTRVAWSQTYLESRTPYAYMDPEPTEKYGMVSFACSRVASLST